MDHVKTLTQREFLLRMGIERYTASTTPWLKQCAFCFAPETVVQYLSLGQKLPFGIRPDRAYRNPSGYTFYSCLPCDTSIGGMWNALHMQHVLTDDDE